MREFLLILEIREIQYRRLQWLSQVTQPGSFKSGFELRESDFHRASFVSVGPVILWNYHLLHKPYFRQRRS